MKSQMVNFSMKRLITVSIIMLVLFLATWIVGIWLGIMPNPGLFNQVSKDKISITTYPKDSIVWVNGESLGRAPVKIERPTGRITICVEKDHYQTFVHEYTDIGSDDIHIQLRFEPSVYILSKSGSSPVWDQSGNLVYFDLDELSLMFAGKEGSDPEVLPINSLVTFMDFSSSGDMVGIEAGALMNEIILLPDNGSQTEIVGYSSVTPEWHPSNGQYFFLGWTDDPFGNIISLWAGKVDQAPMRITLPQVERVEYPTALAWSGDGHYLMVQSLDHIDIWQFSDGLLEYSNSLQGTNAAWAISGSELAYIDWTNDLMLYTAEEKKESLVFSGLPFEHLEWTVDGKSVYGATYNSNLGGSALWEIEIESKFTRLVVDNRKIFGKVVDFRLSPDGKSIATINDLDQISLLAIAE